VRNSDLAINWHSFTVKHHAWSYDGTTVSPLTVNDAGKVPRRRLKTVSDGYAQPIRRYFTIRRDGRLGLVSSGL
jgi:hypothetical protein